MATRRTRTAAPVAESATKSSLDIAGLVKQLEPHVAGALDTLGREAAAGNVQAAKAVLDFLTIAAREQTSDKAQKHLDAIARIRNGQAPDGD